MIEYVGIGARSQISPNFYPANPAKKRHNCGITANPKGITADNRGINADNFEGESVNSSLKS
jgi:hypothetical protein